MKSGMEMLVGIILIGVFAVGCESPSAKSSGAPWNYPPVEAVLTNLDIMVVSVTNLSETLQSEYTRQYPKGPPLKFMVYRQNSFTPSDWTELGPNYYVLAVSNDISPNFLRCRFREHTFTVARVLSVVSELSEWNWWTYRDSVIIEPNSPMFQPSLRFYDAPAAQTALTVVLTHLFSDTNALADARKYLGDFGEGEAPDLRRILMPRSSLPEDFSPPSVGAPFVLLDKEADLDMGDLFCRVHRFLPRGQNEYRVDLFVTGANILGGGWFTYTLRKDGNRWSPKYHGFSDP